MIQDNSGPNLTEMDSWNYFVINKYKALEYTVYLLVNSILKNIVNWRFNKSLFMAPNTVFVLFFSLAPICPTRQIQLLATINLYYTTTGYN